MGPSGAGVGHGGPWPVQGNVLTFQLGKGGGGNRVGGPYPPGASEGSQRQAQSKGVAARQVGGGAPQREKRAGVEVQHLARASRTSLRCHKIHRGCGGSIGRRGGAARGRSAPPRAHVPSTAPLGTSLRAGQRPHVRRAEQAARTWQQQQPPVSPRAPKVLPPPRGVGRGDSVRPRRLCTP